MPVRERMREKEPKPPWAGKGGDGGSGPRGSRTPGSPIPKRPREPPEERVGGRGKPRRVAGAGRDRFGRPSSPPAPEGEPARRQAEPGTARAPPPFTRGGGGGSEGLEASSPDAHGLGGIDVLGCNHRDPLRRAGYVVLFKSLHGTETDWRCQTHF